MPACKKAGAKIKVEICARNAVPLESQKPPWVGTHLTLRAEARRALQPMHSETPPRTRVPRRNQRREAMPWPRCATGGKEDGEELPLSAPWSNEEITINRGQDQLVEIAKSTRKTMAVERVMLYPRFVYLGIQHNRQYVICVTPAWIKEGAALGTHSTSPVIRLMLPTA